ncbi:MAG: hypothetical protein ABIL68_06965 [bacterium]
MRLRLSFFLLFVVIFAIFKCTKILDSVVGEPVRVVLIPSISDTCRYERGMDAVPEGDAILIAWIPSGEENVTEYEIYRGSRKDAVYTQIARVQVPDSTYLDYRVTLDTRHYYYLLAVNDEGIRSEPSDTLNYKLIRKSTGLLPVGVTTIAKPVFSWHDPNTPQKAFYVIRLMESATKQVVWLSLIPSSYSGDRETVQFNHDGTAHIDSLGADIDYQWRVDVVGSEDCSGSESEWIALKSQ